MKTLIQQDEEYDIHVRVIFNKRVLNSFGRKESAYIKNHIGKKLKYDRVLKPPLVFKNSVRVNYKENYHIDMPVFRKIGDILELGCGRVWAQSDPKNINQWITAEKSTKPHLKKIVQLLKKWSKSRNAWNMPSGLINSILASECYCNDELFGKNFYGTLSAINLRLQRNKNIQISNTSISITLNDKHLTKVKNLSERLKIFFEGTFKLYGVEDKLKAIKIWRSFFFADRYFDKFLRNYVSKK